MPNKFNPNVPTIQGGKLAIPGVDGANVRVTPDGRVSVYDFIKVACGINNPRQLWIGDKKKRKGGQRGLAERYPELVRNTDKYKFSGRGGAARPTPVINRAGLFELMQVLPGEVGAKFRRETAQLIVRYLDGDTTLADEVVDRADAKGKHDDIERHAARSFGIVFRKKLTGVACEHGLIKTGYPDLTNLIYILLFGYDAKTLKKRKGLPSSANLRDYLSAEELTLVSTAEIAAAKAINRSNPVGNEAILRVVSETVSIFSLALTGAKQ